MFAYIRRVYPLNIANIFVTVMIYMMGDTKQR